MQKSKRRKTKNCVSFSTQRSLVGDVLFFRLSRSGAFSIYLFVCSQMHTHKIHIFSVKLSAMTEFYGFSFRLNFVFSSTKGKSARVCSLIHLHTHTDSSEMGWMNGKCDDEWNIRKRSNLWRYNVVSTMLRRRRRLRHARTKCRRQNSEHGALWCAYIALTHTQKHIEHTSSCLSNAKNDNFRFIYERISRWWGQTNERDELRRTFLHARYALATDAKSITSYYFFSTFVDCCSLSFPPFFYHFLSIEIKKGRLLVSMV